ncbi:MAG: AarF/UbiB family protein [Actinomycetota bacterium]|nr:AarF/UbiB family protein [Actinomycetota bacterium]
MTSRRWRSQSSSTGATFVRIPRVHTHLCTRRVLVSEYIEGQRFEAVRRASEAQRDRYGEIVFRFFFGVLYRDRVALGDPHPGNYLLCPDGRICFLDFGLLRYVDPVRVADEREIALGVRDENSAALKAALLAAGYLPAARADLVDADLALSLMRMAIKWYAVPGERRFSPDEARRGRDRERLFSEQRAAMKTQVNQFTLPPEAILIRRMHGIVAVVLEQLRAGADWGAIAAEYLHGAPPATPLGQAEADFFARRGRRARSVGRRPARQFASESPNSNREHHELTEMWACQRSVRGHAHSRSRGERFRRISRLSRPGHRSRRSHCLSRHRPHRPASDRRRRSYLRPAAEPKGRLASHQAPPRRDRQCHRRSRRPRAIRRGIPRPGALTPRCSRCPAFRLAWILPVRRWT